jgi:hypothetical protein
MLGSALAGGKCIRIDAQASTICIDDDDGERDQVR